MTSVTPLKEKAEVRLIASPTTWLEGSAVQQLEKTAQLPGMRLAVGLPDLHPGRTGPIGAAFLTADRIYPALVGNDVGCGIGLWRSTLALKRSKLDAWADRLTHLDRSWDGDAEDYLRESGISPAGHEHALGTIGGGNHFAELQCVERVEDAAALDGLGIDANTVLLAVHSGSRGFGEAILRQHVDQHGAAATPDPAGYLRRHDHAVAWARANRRLIARRILARLGADAEPVLDVCHNLVEPLDGGWIHRKGAAPSDRGPVLIPGSRGAFSYLVEPAADCSASAHSLAHGAGRKWARADSRGRLEKRFAPAKLLRTDLGSRVICEDRDLLYEEAPQAYKDITTVIADLVQHGLARVVAVLRPLVTYKVRK